MCDGGPARYYEALCRRFRKALRALSRNNLLLAPVPRGGIGELGSLDAFRDRIRNSDSSDELVALARARCVFVSGDGETGERFRQALRDALGTREAREVLMAALRETAASEVEPDLLSVADMPGGLRDLERAALALQWAPGGECVGHAERRPGLGLPGRGPPRAGRRGRAERLAEAVTLWRNLHGSLRLIADDAFAVEAATSTVKTVIAEACGLDDFGALAATIRDTASRAVADIDALAHGPHRPADRP